MAVVVALTMVEVIVRVFEEEKYDFSACQSLDRNLHHVMIANSSCRFKSDEWDTVYKINSLGLRDEEVIHNEDTFRILLLGDSFAQGYGVEAEESFGEVIESQGENIEVVNSGISGYSPLLEYLYLKKGGLALSPDLVILAASLTDFFEDRQRFGELKLVYPQKSTDQIKELIAKGEVEFDFSKINAASSPGESVSDISYTTFKIKQFLRRNYRTYKLAADLWDKRDEVQQDVIYLGDIDRDILALVRGEKITDSDWEKLWELPIEHVKLIKKELGGAGIPLVVITIPDAFAVSDREWPGRKSLGIADNFYDPRGDWQDELSRRLAGLDILFLDLTADFRKSDIYPLYFSRDGHLRKSGHRLAANVIFAELAKYFNLQ